MISGSTLRRGLLVAFLGLNVGAVVACTTTVSEIGGDGGTGGSGGAGGSDPACTGFEDTSSSSDFTVTVRNATSEAVYLSGLDCEPNIELRLYDATDQAVSFRDGVCHFTCAELQVTDPICPAGCALPPIIMIAPGGTYELPWNGTIHEPVEMPPSCHHDPELAAATCDQKVVAPSGAYAFAVTGHDDSWCPLDMPGACACTPDATGSCVVETPGEIISGDGVDARATFSFPGDDGVEIVFD